MKKNYIITLLLFTFLNSFSQAGMLNNSTLRNRWEVYTPLGATDVNRLAGIAVGGRNNFWVYTTNIIFDKFASFGDKVLYCNLNGEINSLPLSNFVQIETDPIYISGIVNYFTKTQADIRYLQSFTESDPIWIIDKPTYSTKSISDGLYKDISYVPSWTDITGKPSFFSGIYSDLTGKPILFDGDYNNLSNKPSIPTNTNQLTNGAGFLNSVPAQSFSSLTSKPTTLSGYGITDSYPLNGNPSGFLLSIPLKTYNNIPNRSLVTVAAAANGWQISTTKDSDVTYSVTISCSVQIGVVANVEGYVVLEIAATNSSTASDWKEISRTTSAQNISLAIALASTEKGGGSISGGIPATWYCRIRSVNVAGTPTYVLNGQQESY